MTNSEADEIKLGASRRMAIRKTRFLACLHTKIPSITFSHPQSTWNTGYMIAGDRYLLSFIWKFETPQNKGVGAYPNMGATSVFYGTI